MDPVSFYNKKLTWNYISKKRIQKNIIYRKKEVHLFYNNDLENRKKFVDEIKERLKICPIIITKNKYPYWTEEGVLHCVIWMDKKYSFEEILKFINENSWPFKEKLYPASKGEMNIFIYENLPEMKSIKDIEHYQVFFRVQK